MNEQGQIDSALQALADPYRRQLLTHLLVDSRESNGHHNPLNIGKADEEPRSSAAQLVHNHLPMLVHEGYIEWDEDDNKVSRGPRWDEIEPLIALLHENQEKLPGDWP